MHADVATTFFRLPAELRPVVAKEIRRKKLADARAHIENAYGGLLAPTFDSAAYTEDQKKSRAHREVSRPGAMKGAKVQRWRGADQAGARWRPDFKSPLNPAVFPTWGKVPAYVPALCPLMSAAVARTIIIIGDVVDHRGDFVLPRATHARRIGTSERVAFGTLETLRSAGLLRVKHRGNRTQATIWSYAPVADVDLVRARRVLQAARRRATERIEATAR